MERKSWTEPFDMRLVAAGLQLARGDIVTVRGCGALVFVEAGGVWITQDADARDLIVGAGEWQRLDSPGLAIVQATAPSIITITAPSEGPAPKVELAKPAPAAKPARRRGGVLRRFWAAWLRLYRRHSRPRPWDEHRAPASASAPSRPQMPVRDPIAATRAPQDPLGAAFATGLARGD